MRQFLIFAALFGFVLTPLMAENPSSKWEPAIQKFVEQDKASAPPENGVLFVGSSSIRLWDLEKSFPEKNYLNRGFGGSQIADSIAFVDQLVLKHQPKVVLMYAGDNDIAAGKSAQTVAQDFKTFQMKVNAKLPDTKIMYIAIKPSIKRWDMYPKMSAANQLIAEYCKTDDRLTYLDIASPMLGEDGTPKPGLFAKDGLHLNEAGYEVWTSVVAPHLNASNCATE
jgi:lysophospholipase L1-like esterase